MCLLATNYVPYYVILSQKLPRNENVKKCVQAQEVPEFSFIAYEAYLDLQSQKLTLGSSPNMHILKAHGP